MYVNCVFYEKEFTGRLTNLHVAGFGSRSEDQPIRMETGAGESNLNSTH